MLYSHRHQQSKRLASQRAVSGCWKIHSSAILGEATAVTVAAAAPAAARFAFVLLQQQQP
jgi:hypothetical protein